MRFRRLPFVLCLAALGPAVAAVAQDAVPAAPVQPLDVRPFGTVTPLGLRPPGAAGAAATPSGTATTTTPAGAPAAAGTPAPAAAAGAPDDAAAADTDAIVTGAVPPEPPASRRVGAEPVIDTSDPAAGFITGVMLRRTIDDDPWAPLGIRAGSFILYPSVDLATGYTSNAAKTHGGKGAGFAIIAPEFLARSDWSRHEATLALRGSYEAFTNGTSEPGAEAEATARLDLVDRWTADFATHYRYGRESASDPNAPDNVDRHSDIHNFGGSAALNGALGRNVFTLETSLDRTLYGDARAGTRRIDQGDRDNTVYGTRLRLGYPLSGTLTPFVEGAVTRRQYDDRVDDNGIRRSSTGEAARIGVAIDRAPVTTGEVAVGYAWENYDDAALRTLGAFTVDGSLAWSPVELVTLTTTVASAINPSTDRRSAGSVTYDAAFDVAYAWRRNATLDAVARVRNEAFEGTGRREWTYGVGLGATWRVNRMIELALAYTHEWLQSNRRGRNYTDDTVRLDARFRF